MAKFLIVCVLAAVAQASVFLKEDFTPGWEQRWIKSEATKDGAQSDIAKYDGVWEVTGGNNSFSLVASVANKHYGIGANFEEAFQFSANKNLVVQYEVKYDNPMNCGGSYVKLLSDTGDLNLQNLVDKTPYTILFGPDKCGADSHLRFIYRFVNPTTSQYREVHANKIENAYSLLFSEPRRTHLVTLIVRADNSFVIRIDNTQVAEGNLASSDDFDPALQPDKNIDDPTDVKPADWVDEQEIDDPEDFKPEDWDESQPAEIEDESATKPATWDETAPAVVPDPDATKPEDWSDEEDGEWEAPIIDNPVCATGCGPWVRPKIRNPLFKGKWRAKRIPNPLYKGEWSPRKIANPEFFEETAPYAKLDSIKAIGLELWTITAGITFSSFIVTNDEQEAADLATSSWLPKKTAEEELANAHTSLLGNIKSVYLKLRAAADEAPYLYIVFTAVVGLPLILIVRCLTGSKNVEESESAPVAVKPKTVVPTNPVQPASSPVEPEDVEPENETEPPTEETAPVSNAPSKAAETQEISKSETQAVEKPAATVETVTSPAPIQPTQATENEVAEEVSVPTTPTRRTTRKLRAET